MIIMEAKGMAIVIGVISLWSVLVAAAIVEGPPQSGEETATEATAYEAPIGFVAFAIIVCAAVIVLIFAPKNSWSPYP